jgi:hypothetical protein
MMLSGTQPLARAAGSAQAMVPSSRRTAWIAAL